MGSGSQTEDCESTKSCHQTSLPDTIKSSACPVLRTTRAFSIGLSALIASLTFCFNSTILPRLYPPSAVIINLDCESSTLSRIDSALNPPKITLCGAPILAHASIEITNSGTIGRYMVTLSPLCTPRLFRALAHLLTSRNRSQYVYTFQSPGSPSHINAALFLFSDLACLSTQL